MTFLCQWHEIRRILLHAKLIFLWLRFGGLLGGLRVFNVSAGAWRGGRTGQFVAAGSVPCISLALVRSAPRLEMLQLRRSGASVIIDLHLPTNLAGVVLRCRIDLHSQGHELSRFSSGEPSIVCIGDRCDDAVARGMRLDRWWNRRSSPGAGWKRAATEQSGDLAGGHVSMVRRPPAASCRSAGIV